MKVLSLEPELLVEDMGRTLMFYKEILGFDVELAFPEDNPSFARIKKDGIRIMLNDRKSFEEDILKFKGMKMGGTEQIFIKAVGIEDYYKEIKDKVNVMQPLHKTDYGSLEFIIEDCNGYFIGFSEDISTK
jgi:predicted enzyme related to lactoylglutathione lyase